MRTILNNWDGRALNVRKDIEKRISGNYEEFEKVLQEIRIEFPGTLSTEWDFVNKKFIKANVILDNSYYLVISENGCSIFKRYNNIAKINANIYTRENVAEF